MRCGPLLLFVVLLLPYAAQGADPWQPAAGPMMTRWAGKVSPDNALPEYPRPQMVRAKWMNLNGLWQFAHAKRGEQPPLGRPLSRRILVPFPVESALSGVMEPAERVWYRRTFTLPADWQGGRVLLHFGAVDWETTVWINGTSMGTHRGGYDGFTFDVTDALKDDGEQEVVVGVFDPTDAGTQAQGKQLRTPRGIWYTPTTGIWQTVWLEPVPAAHIQKLRLTPDVDHNRLRLVVLGGGTDGRQRVRAVALKDGREVARVSGPVGSELHFDLDQPRLWSPDHPFLYDLRVELQAGGKTLDRVESYFGMRKIEVRPGKTAARMLLNNREVFQIGPLDQGFWPDGLYTAPTDEALRYDIEVTRKLGFNMTRKHVKVEPARWYYWCDRLGLLVWQDMPSARHRQKDKPQFEAELRRMVEGRGNHPSIIMWVVFNEGWGQYDTERLTRWVKQLDPQRLVSNASGWHDRRVGDVLDMHRYPGPAANVPESRRANVLGEFGGLGLPIRGHVWPRKTWSYQGVGSGDQLTLAYMGLLREVYVLRKSQTLQAAVYTQLTDVEREANGLMTYDRAVVKVDPRRVAAANRGKFPKPRPVVEDSQHTPHVWRYTQSRPADDWRQVDFDDSGWDEGPAGFGTAGTPGATVRTTWKSGDLWLRREFELAKDGIPREPMFRVHHDERAEIFINGAPAAVTKGFTTGYVLVPMTAEARKTLHAGRNTMAVHVHQTGGGQYIDVGIIDWSDQPAAK